MMRVGVVGAAGRMGREVCKAVANAQDMELAFAVDKNGVGERVSQWADQTSADLVVSANLDTSLAEKNVDAIVDFTHPNAAEENATKALRSGAIPIIGTSGLSGDSLNAIRRACAESNLPALYVPNFAIGAVLMMKFSQEAAKYFPDAEVIELHHNKKADAPSGTAMRTAEMIAESRKSDPSKDPTEVQKAEGARGGEVQGVHVHSVRLPGLLAHQQVIFGGPGEVLTIRHDSMDRASFMQGVLLAIRKCKSLSGLAVGLESVMQ
jgi:4-hydroxy-tetrahydrodipicolinate reductase